MDFKLNWPHGYTEFDIKRIEDFMNELIKKVEDKTKEPDTLKKLAYAFIALADNYIKLEEQVSNETLKLIEELEKSA